MNREAAPASPDSLTVGIPVPYPVAKSQLEARAATLSHDPTSVALMASLHTLRTDGVCGQCAPAAWWPCQPWQVAALATMLIHAPAPTRVRWFG